MGALYFWKIFPWLKKSSTQVEEICNLSLEDLMKTRVTSASKSSESLQDAPAVISVITSKEIEGYGALTLVDVLNRATALYITGSYYFPNNLAAMRGDAQTHTTSHVLILLDGRPCRESFYGGIDLVIFNAFPLSAIDHIEIIRGPGSILYGTNAFSGVINIISKQSEENSVNVSSRLGSFGTGTIAFHQSSFYKGLKIATDAQYMSQKGWDFSAVDQNGMYKSTKYGQENIGVNLSASYKNLTLRTFYGNSYRDIFGDKPIWPTDGTFNTLNTYRGFVDLGYHHVFSTKWNSTFNGTFNSFAQRSIRDLRPVDFWLQ